MGKQGITRNNGITLIVLVITIIILLILSGLTIMSIFGENGLVFRAKQAKTNMEEAQRAENKILEDYYSKINEYIDNENKDNNNSDELMDREHVEFVESSSSIINTEQRLFKSVNGVTLNKGETRKIEIPNNLIETQLIIQLNAKYGRDQNSVAIYFYDVNNEQILDAGTHFEYAGGTTEKITKEYTIPQNCKYIEFWVGDGPYDPYMIINNIGIAYSVLNISGEKIGSNQTLTSRGLNYYSTYYNLRIENTTQGTTKILYKIDEGEWKEYNNEELRIEKSCTIYVRGYNENDEVGIIEKTFVINKVGLTNNSFDLDNKTYDLITNSTRIAISSEIYGKTLEIKLNAKYGRDENSVAIYFYDVNNERLLDTGTHFEYAGGTTEKITKEYTIPQNCKYIEFWIGDGPYNPYMYIYEILVK